MQPSVHCITSNQERPSPCWLDDSRRIHGAYGMIGSTAGRTLRFVQACRGISCKLVSWPEVVAHVALESVSQSTSCSTRHGHFALVSEVRTPYRTRIKAQDATGRTRGGEHAAAVRVSALPPGRFLRPPAAVRDDVAAVAGRLLTYCAAICFTITYEDRCR